MAAISIAEWIFWIGFGALSAAALGGIALSLLRLGKSGKGAANPESEPDFFMGLW